MNRIITLTTDFGTRDGFVGMMKGVILGINPQATIVDITHEIAPQDVEQGAFLFAASAKYFPANTIHVVVVDPGVGGTRRPIAIQAGEAIFVAPDNGVVSLAIPNLQSPTNAIRAIHLNRPEYWLPQVSHTFHGRDVFAPVAAHLSLGVPLEALGDQIDDWIRLAPAAPVRRSDGALVAHVRHIDSFGNIVIDVVEKHIAGWDRSHAVVTIAGRTLRGIRQTYAQVAPGELIALIGSSGNLEAAAREASAAQILGVRIGDQVVLVP